MGSIFFFFSSRRRHTRSLRDWSSDVCSSDLKWCLLPENTYPSLSNCMFSTHFQRNNIHDRVHQALNRPNITSQHRDKSCNLCYLPEVVSTNNFNTFWEWYISEYPARAFSWYTQQYFKELSYVEGEDIWLAIIDLIFSIRYSYTPVISFEGLQQEIWNAYNITQGFQLALFTVTFRHSELSFITPEDSEDSSERSTPAITELNDFDLYTEDLHLDQLFQQPEIMAQPNQQDFQQLQAAIAALTQVLPNTNNALTGNTQAITNPPHREGRVAELPYFYGGNQDPIAWLEDFTRACNANGIQDARKLEVVPAYLKGAASTWWNANQALNNGNQNRVAAWTGNNNNTDFILNFPNAFRTQTLDRKSTRLN